ncbi:RNA polymerase sigma factor [Spirosoma endbachense]|uniref:RNA polymerase sigma-70 region 2 domain-containing protein n=1 Tax=Spirosoma endbachense TaxID=2666025 RepID=A0A6P1VZW9_9BACT|nr:hypothetical protein [Spirosoma endbachense]QHV98683.1 hypothetical protein GJR95_28380 [Spirosoma endbachense]
MSTSSITSTGGDQQSFLPFYDRYASKLWGLILGANLPMDQAETILANALLRAWQAPDPLTTSEQLIFARLVRLTFVEGLPATMLSTILNT